MNQIHFTASLYLALVISLSLLLCLFFHLAHCLRISIFIH